MEVAILFLCNYINPEQLRVLIERVDFAIQIRNMKTVRLQN